MTFEDNVGMICYETVCSAEISERAGCQSNTRSFSVFTVRVTEWLGFSPQERKVGVRVPAGSNQGLYKIGIFAAVPPGALHYGNSAKVGRPGVGILQLGGM